MKLIFPVLFLICLFSACSNDKDEEFVLPSTIKLDSNTFFDPIFTDQLLESPLKYGVIWNDSLLKHGKIFKIQITNTGILSPDAITERIEYLFDRKGNFKEYGYYNFKFSDSVYSKMIGEFQDGTLTSIQTQLFYGEKENSEILIRRSEDCIQYIRINKPGLNDTASIYLKDKHPVLIVDKLGNYISKVQFIGDFNSLRSEAKTWLKRIHISDENWENTEKIIIQTENNLPLIAYMLNSDLKKTDLCAQWIYKKDNKLSNYKKYINGNCVMEFTFQYSDDKVMRSFTMNRKLYQIKYN